MLQKYLSSGDQFTLYRGSSAKCSVHTSHSPITLDLVISRLSSLVQLKSGWKSSLVTTSQGWRLLLQLRRYGGERREEGGEINIRRGTLPVVV